MSLYPELDKAIRRVPDFPKKGILFYDITGILMNPTVFQNCITVFEEKIKGIKIDAIAAIESRGFVFASPLADRLGLPLILVRKKGKLPGKTFSKKYNLEYGSAEIEIHEDDCKKGQNILIIDDLIATGGTLKAAVDLFRDAGAIPVQILGVVGLPFLNYGSVLNDVPVHTLIEYDSE